VIDAARTKGLLTDNLPPLMTGARAAQIALSQTNNSGLLSDRRMVAKLSEVNANIQGLAAILANQRALQVTVAPGETVADQRAAAILRGAKL